MLTADPVAAALARLELQKRQAAVAPARRAYTASFRQFIQHNAPQVEFYRHVDVLVNVLQKVADGKIKRLMVFMPPRSGKSLIVSRLLPAYLARRRPEHFVGLASYGATLADQFGREARGYYTSDGGELDPASRAVDRWITHAGGGMWSAGVGGALTGRGFHVGIGDDLIKGAQEADSPTIRARTQDWLETVFLTRAEPGAAIILVMTRWHLDDPAGFLLEKEATAEQPEGWHLVDMPAIAEPQPTGQRWSLEPDWRQPGEPLCPERFPLERLHQMRDGMASRWWRALYQQRPTVATGTIIVREFFRYYDPEQLPEERIIRTIASIDCTFKDGSGSDFVALTIWSQLQPGAFLRDVVNQRMGFVATVAAIKAAWEKWRFGELLVEDAANGSAVIDTLKREANGYSIRAVKPLGGKEARANAAAPMYEQGRVFHPSGALWLQDYENQLLAFPAGAHDDMVDSTTQLLNYVQAAGPMKVSTVSWGYGSDSVAPAAPPHPNYGHSLAALDEMAEDEPWQ